MAAINSPNCSAVSGLVLLLAINIERGGIGFLGTPVTGERLRAKGLNRWLKENAKTRHFSEAVSNLLANDEGGLVKTKPLTWRR